jgi:general secretion pathway protein F/type IV pilus assembly protein PilC
MAMFSYIARDVAGQRITGRLAGASEQAVLNELSARQLAPVQVRQVRERPALRRRVPARQLATAYRQLAELLRAGVPLLRALRLLGRAKARARLGSILLSVADAIADGSRLADAMMRQGEVFPPVHIAMVRAGERGGFLEEVLERMGAFLELRAEQRSRVIGNLIYPALLLVVGAAIVIVALVAFVPRFKDLYAKIALPLPTRILMALSDLFTLHWPWLLASITVAAAAAAWLGRNPRIRRGVAAWQLRVPMLGPLLQSLAVGRFTRTLGTLLENGIPMLAAMQISREAAGNVLLEEAIARATEAVRAGESLARPLAESGLFGEDVIEMITVGESANNLPVVLLGIADTIERRIDRMLGLLLRLMEPLLLLLLAGMVLFIFIALIVPMMRLSSALGA